VPILAMQGYFYETLLYHVPIYLDKQWLERSVDCGGPSTWPASSPDFNLLDFYVWCHLKSIVYVMVIYTQCNYSLR
jgi:hypothetical protein